MKIKVLSVFLLTLISALALVSAASFTINPVSIVLQQPINSTSVIITSTNPVDLTATFPASINGITFSIPESLTNITSKTISLVPSSSGALDSSFKFGVVYSGNVYFNNTANQSSDNIVLPVKIIKSYCVNGEQTQNLTITSVSITNDGSGDDADWKPLDDIEIKVKVENADGDNKITGIVKVGLYNNKGSEKLGLDSINVGKIGSSEKTATFNFKVPSDLADDSYFLYVKVYKDGNEKNVCTAIADDLDNKYYQTIDISKEDEEGRQVIFDAIILDPTTATCGEDVTLSANIVNVGTSDQEKLKTSIYNKALGVDEFIITDNVDEGNSIPIDFTFTVPSNAAEKTYIFDLSNKYDYNADHPATEDTAYDTYGDSFTVSLQVSGCKAPAVPSSVSITPSLVSSESDVKAGNDIVIKATLTNTGSSAATYVVSLEGAEAFAAVKSINPSVLTLDAGKSGDVLITLSLNKDASGDQVFNIKSTSNGADVKQAVSLSIASSSGLGLSGLGNSIKNNWVIWVIVLINVVLIIAIIIVAIKVTRA